MRKLPALFYSKKSDMIYTFLSHRILNPILVKNCQKISEFSQKINIYSDSV